MDTTIYMPGEGWETGHKKFRCPGYISTRMYVMGLGTISTEGHFPRGPKGAKTHASINL